MFKGSRVSTLAGVALPDQNGDLGRWANIQNLVSISLGAPALSGAFPFSNSTFLLPPGRG
jgi:hypothetical protein